MAVERRGALLPVGIGGQVTQVWQTTRMTFTDLFLATYPRIYKERPCVVCMSTADEDRGWVKPQDVPDSKYTYWLCNACLDRKPTLEWDGEVLRGVTLPSASSSS